MFETTLSAELARRIGSRIEIATATNFIEGVLTSVSTELVIAVQVSGYGYGSGNTVYISLDAISFVRILSTAA